MQEPTVLKVQGDLFRSLNVFYQSVKLSSLNYFPLFGHSLYNCTMFDFAEKRPSDVPIVVLDTETTGLFAEMGHRVVEIGAVRLENWQEVGQINTLLQPNRPMESKASQVNGIRDADLVGQPTFAAISVELLALLDGALLVAHNAEFDARFLGMEFYIQGMQAGKPPVQLANPWLCTLQLARGYFNFGRNNLGHIANLLGVRTGNAHRALADVYTTAEILKRMVKELERQRLTTVGDLLYAQGSDIFAPDFTNLQLPDELDVALQNDRSLRILYESRSGDSRRKITPLYPTQFKGSLYLVAYCHYRDEQRTFKVDRIIEAELV